MQIRDRRPPLVPPLTDGDATESWIDEGPVLAVDLGHVGERKGVTAALELLRTLLALSGPESHEVGLRAVAQLLVDDRRHG